MQQTPFNTWGDCVVYRGIAFRRERKRQQKNEERKKSTMNITDPLAFHICDGTCKYWDFGEGDLCFDTSTLCIVCTCAKNKKKTIGVCIP